MHSRYTIAASNTHRQPSVWLTARRSSRGAVETMASTGTHHRRRVAQLVVLAALVVTGAVLVGQPLAHAAPRVTGLERVSDFSDSNSHSPQYAFAGCPNPEKVVGDGASAVYADPPPPLQVTVGYVNKITHGLENRSPPGGDILDKRRGAPVPSAAASAADGALQTGSVGVQATGRLGGAA
jgi:hypothetical protein